MSLQEAQQSFTSYQTEVNQACIAQLLKSIGRKQAIQVLLDSDDESLNHIPLINFTHNLLAVSKHAISLQDEVERKKYFVDQHIRSIKKLLSDKEDV